MASSARVARFSIAVSFREKKQGKDTSPFPIRLLPYWPAGAGNRSSQGGLRFVNDGRKRGLVVDGDIGEHPTVELDARLLETGDQLAVGDAFGAGLGIDTGDPQGTEGALLDATVAERVLTGLGDGLDRNAVDAAAGAVVALGQVENLLVTTVCGDTTLYSCHVILPLSDAQHTVDKRLVGRIHDAGATQIALTLLGHLGENVAAHGMLVLVARGGFLEPLGGSTVYFGFWHWNNSRLQG